MQRRVSVIDDPRAHNRRFGGPGRWYRGVRIERARTSQGTAPGSTFGDERIGRVARDEV